jgi:hypothetical protein
MRSHLRYSARLRALAIAAVLAALCTAAAAAPLYKSAETTPSDAIVLFNGKDLSQWVKCGTDQPPAWKVEKGYAEAHGGDICSRQLFNDCQLHVEFWVPLMAEATGQHRSNSGVFLKGFTYEIQILDSYNLNPGVGDCGAVYSLTPPSVNACRPPEHWQSFDIIFHEPKFDAAGKKTANARVTVLQNGILIHDNVEVTSATPNHSAAEPTGAGPIQLQDHGCPVRFRNVWVRPLPAVK